jgi:hypothetical protein
MTGSWTVLTGSSPRRQGRHRAASGPGSPVQLVAAFRSYYGPTMNPFEAAEAAGRADSLQDELEALFDSQNTSAAGSTSIPATYLRVEISV